MKKIIGTLCCSMLFLLSQSQEKLKVEEAVRDYVDAFYYGDTSKVYNSISQDLVKHGFYVRRGGSTYEPDTMSFRQCVDYAANVKKRGANANVDKFPKKIEVFDVQDKTASAKLTACGEWIICYLLRSTRSG